MSLFVVCHVRPHPPAQKRLCLFGQNTDFDKTQKVFSDTPPQIFLWRYEEVFLYSLHFRFRVLELPSICTTASSLIWAERRFSWRAKDFFRHPPRFFPYRNEGYFSDSQNAEWTIRFLHKNFRSNLSRLLNFSKSRKNFFWTPRNLPLKVWEGLLLP